jgi:imidazolonepropionase-like amidohydrolase
MQTFLPGTPYILGKELNLPLKKCIDNDWAFSLASDFNPNYNSLSIPFVGSLATHRLGITPLEALIGVTRNPATTLFSKDADNTPGTIRVNGPADMLIINSKEIDGWCQYPGDNPILKTICKGDVVKL